MPIQEFAPGKEILNPRGAWSVTAQKRKGSPQRASYMQNARTAPGITGSRPGTTGAGVAATGKVTGMFNWIPGIPPTTGYTFGGSSTNSFGSVLSQADVPRETVYIFEQAPTTFSGWNIAGTVNTIVSVTVFVDSVAIPGVTIGLSRPDVAAIYPGQAGSPDFGWSVPIDLTGYAVGYHTIQITATDSAANIVIVQMTFYVIAIPGPERNLLLYQDGAAIKSTALPGGTPVSLIAGLTTTRAPAFADLDIWTYFCGYDTSGNGTIQAQIYDGSNVDIAFRGPVTLTGAGRITPPFPFPGQVTAGAHLFGVVYQNRTGFAGKPTTTVLGVPVTFTAGPADTIQIEFVINGLFDSGGNSTLYLIMTTADNPQNWFFVPTDAQSGSIGELPVPAVPSGTFIFIANVSDEDLNASADSANSQFLLLTQDSLGNGPFLPSQVVPYGQRMVYVVGPFAYVSDINNPQQLTGDQNVVAMPNARRIGCAFPLPGSTSLFLTGDRWTAYVTDNSDVPATWAQPVGVSGSLGAPFPNLVCFQTGGNYAWVVTEAGPYRFAGVYDDRPLTYLCADQWALVNWAAAYAIQIVDNVADLKLYVGVPTGSGTEPSMMFVIDYQNGMEFDEVDISTDVFNPALFSSLAIVKEPVTAVSNVWIGPSEEGAIAHFDSTTTEDQGNAIDSFWRSGLVRGTGEIVSSMIRVGGFDVWIRGSGAPIMLFFRPDDDMGTSLQLLSASGYPANSLLPKPGIMYAIKCDFRGIENFLLQCGTNAVGASWQLSGFRGYMKADLFNR